ncbi:hypothetical protein V8E51_000385 [Hyaloscypha variabilis]
MSAESGSGLAMSFCQDTLGSEVVQIFVGPEKQLFQVHKTLLCSASEFFKKAFNGDFVEAFINQMDLPEDKPEIFAMFVAWLYGNGKLVFDLENCGAFSGVDELIQLYVFANGKCCDALKNSTMDMLRAGLAQSVLHLDEKQIQYIFANTYSTAEAPIRRFCVAWITYGMPKRWIDVEDVMELFKSSPDILMEYLNFQAEYPVPEIHYENPEISRVGRLYKPCFFHMHKVDEICTAGSQGNSWAMSD